MDVHIPLSVVSMSYGIFASSSPSGTVYCGAASRPEGWQSDWYSGSNVVWNCVEIIEKDGVKYSRSADDTLSVIGSPSAKGAIVIPDEINGYPVVSIYKNAFKNNYLITSVTLPDTVTSIGHNAFYSCIALTEINLTDSLTSIGEYAFYSCTSLGEIKIPGTVDTVSRYAFFNCNNATVSLSERE